MIGRAYRVSQEGNFMTQGARAEDLELIVQGYRSLIHDIKHPFSLLPHYIDALRKEGNLREENETFIKLRTILTRTSALLDSAMIASQIFSGSFSTHPLDEDISKLIDEVVTFFRPLYDRSQLRIDWKHNPDHITLPLDPAMFPRVIYNLLSNALKFTPPGGTISILLDAKPASVTLTVRDTGKGIPPEKLALAFESYRRPTRETNEGSGLGLFIVKRIVEAHGGTASIESAVGKGTTVTINLPRRVVKKSP